MKGMYGKVRYQFFYYLLLTVLTIQIPSCSHVPEPPESIATISEFEEYMEKAAGSGTPPGMSLVIVKDDSIVYSKGFGWADFPKKIPASGESVYHWWSITKIPTAIAILQLQEKGELNINDPVTKYLSFFKVQYPSDSCKEITILNLLNHTSGLPDLGFRLINMIHHEDEPPVNQTELIKELLPDFSELEFAPGEGYAYTNIGYMLLGAVIEKITGITYEDYIRENILQPLEMDRTDFIYTEAMKNDEAAGAHPLWSAYGPFLRLLIGSYIREYEDGDLWFERVYTDQTPSTGLIGPVTDAAHLAIAYLNKGEYNGKRILSEESVAKMTYEEYIKKIDEDSLSKKRQGLGWQIYGKPGERWVVTHEGGGPGFRTRMQLYPDEKLGIILFTNDVTCELWKIVNLAGTIKWGSTQVSRQ